MKPWWNPRGTFPGPRRTLEEIGGTLVEPSNARGTLPQTTSDHPAALAEPGETLAEFWWKSGGTLVEPSSNQTTPALEEIAGTLVEFSWNLTSNHPRPPRCLEPWWNPVVEPWWNPGGTLVEPWWSPGGTLVEPWWNPWWNPGGTLAQGRPEPPRSLSGLRPQSFQLLGGKKGQARCAPPGNM